MTTYKYVTCPHCGEKTYNNKPHCGKCGLLLSKTKGCNCDYCKNKCSLSDKEIISQLMAGNHLNNKELERAEQLNKGWQVEIKRRLNIK